MTTCKWGNVVKITKLRTQSSSFPTIRSSACRRTTSYARAAACWSIWNPTRAPSAKASSTPSTASASNFTTTWCRASRRWSPAPTRTMSGAIFARAWAEIRTLGQSGFAVNALAGLDMALWDLRAKLAGVNVGGLIGACRTTLPVYDSGDYWVHAVARRIAAQRRRQHGARLSRLQAAHHRQDRRRHRRVHAMREVIGRRRPARRSQPAHHRGQCDPRSAARSRNTT